MAEETEKDRKFQPKIVPPRDDYYMGLLLITAVACRDPVYQQAAIIIDNKDRWIAHGLNFLVVPEGHAAKKVGWDQEGRDLALVTAGESAVDRALKLYTPGAAVFEPLITHTMFLAGPPTLRCVRRSVSHGLKDVIYGPIKPALFDEQDWSETQKLAELHNLRMKPFQGNLNWLRDRVLSLSHLF